MFVLPSPPCSGPGAPRLASSVVLLAPAAVPSLCWVGRAVDRPGCIPTPAVPCPQLRGLTSFWDTPVPAPRQALRGAQVLTLSCSVPPTQGFGDCPHWPSPVTSSHSDPGSTGHLASLPPPVESIRPGHTQAHTFTCAHTGAFTDIHTVTHVHRHTHLHVHTQVHTFIHVHTQVHTHSQMCTHRHTHAYTCTQKYTHVNTCITQAPTGGTCTHTYTCVYTQRHTRVHTSTHVRAQVHSIHMCTHVCTHASHPQAGTCTRTHTHTFK